MKARDGRDPRELAAMDLDVHLNDGNLKRKYVATMFDIIAPGYNSFTHLFSFGMDRNWKARLVAEGVKRAVKDPLVLDLACGTGDLGIALGAGAGARMTLGFDLSAQMLTEAQVRLRKEGAPMKLAACDMLHLAVGDATVDVVSIGYGLRNTSDAPRGLREIARVLKPGGLMLNLDFYRPKRTAWRELYLWYLWNAGRLGGWLWHREPIVYGYIAPSIRRYLTMEEFENELRAAGFALEWKASRLGGGIGMHVARKLA